MMLQRDDVARESEQLNTKKLVHLLPRHFLLDFSPANYSTSKKNGPVFYFQLILTRFWRCGYSMHCEKTADSDLFGLWRP